MAEVFSFRSLIYWWGILSATVFVKGWLEQLASFLKTSGTFTPDKIPFSLVPGLNSWIDGAAKYIRDSITFDPNQIVAGAGTFAIKGWMLALFFGVLLLILAVVLSARALQSPAWFDDFVVLLVIYVILRMVGHIVAIASLPFLDWFRALVDNPATAFGVLLVLLLFLSFLGEGVRSKRAFWRALIEAGVVSLFMFPLQTSIALGYGVDALAAFGAGLSRPENLPFAMVWGLIGMFLAFQRLATQEIVQRAER
ncbi:MAG: hypothetical protein KGJ80_11420 [Chloroflexota bacterium]|nr:hypothetical protein [Chloroflexota bacterium]